MVFLNAFLVWLFIDSTIVFPIAPSYMFLDSISMAGDGHISIWQVINCVVEEEICVCMMCIIR